MIKNFTSALDKYFYAMTFTALFFIAAFNGFSNIGLWQDGGWCVYEMFQPSVSLDFSRLFAHVCLHVPAFCLKFLGLDNAGFLKLIIVSHGMWFFMLPLIPLFFSFLVLPRDKKDWFVFPLMSYLAGMVFSSYFIVSEMYVTLYLFWFVLMAFSFVDFKTISLFKQAALLAAAFILIRSYQVSAFLSLLLLAVGTHNFYVSKNAVAISKKIFFYAVFLFLACSAAVSFYYMLNPIDTNVSKVFDNLKILRYKYFVFFFLTALAVSLVDYKNKYFKIAAVSALAAVSYKFMLNNLDLLKHAHDFRHFSVIFTVLFSFLMTGLLYCGKRVNFNLWKIVSCVLLCLFSVNSVIFTNRINLAFGEIPVFLSKSHKNIVPIGSFLETFPDREIIIDSFVLPRQAILAQVLYGGDKTIRKILIDEKSISDMQDFFNVTNDRLTGELALFGIKYGTRLKEDINKIKQEQTDDKIFNGR